MSRIQTTFDKLEQHKRKALIPFFTAGDPNPALTLPDSKTYRKALEKEGPSAAERKSLGGQKVVRKLSLSCH